MDHLLWLVDMEELYRWKFYEEILEYGVALDLPEKDARKLLRAKIKSDRTLLPTDT